MKRDNYKILKEKQPLKEMANLRNTQTGLSNGTLYISTQEGNHGPRVKFFRGSPGNTPSASITISDTPEIIEDSIDISEKEIREITAYVMKNKEALLNFWNNGHTWYSDEVEKFKKKILKKISKDDIKGVEL